MTPKPLESHTPRGVSAPSSIWLALIVAALLAIAGCGGATSPAPTVGGGGATTEPTSSASGAAACIDAETAAIIQSLAAPGADVEGIITEQGDELVAGLESFTPPADAATWRDDLVAAVESGDTEAVQAQVEMIGTEITLEFC